MVLSECMQSCHIHLWLCTHSRIHFDLGRHRLGAHIPSKGMNDNAVGSRHQNRVWELSAVPPKSTYRTCFFVVEAHARSDMHLIIHQLDLIRWTRCSAVPGSGRLAQDSENWSSNTHHAHPRSTVSCRARRAQPPGTRSATSRRCSWRPRAPAWRRSHPIPCDPRQFMTLLCARCNMSSDVTEVPVTVTTARQPDCGLRRGHAWRRNHAQR